MIENIKSCKSCGRSPKLLKVQCGFKDDDIQYIYYCTHTHTDRCYSEQEARDAWDILNTIQNGKE